MATRLRLRFSVTLLLILGLLQGVTATVDSDAVTINSNNSERNLSVDGATDDNSDDRAINAKLPGIAKVVEALKANSPYVDDLLSKLKGHTSASNLFESQQFKALSSHLADIYPDKADEVMAWMLATKYEDEALTMLLRQARENDQTKALANKLSAARIANWLDEGVTADAAFLKLRLPDSGHMLVWFPETRLWLTFVSSLHPQNADGVILSVLKTHYKTDEQLGYVLQYGLEANKDIAERLKGIVLKYWQSEQESAENVFEFLLKRHGNFALETKYFNDWASYVYMVDKQAPLTTMFKVLDKRFGSQLPDILDKAAQVPKDLAEKLKVEMWISKKRSASTVFSELHLHWAGYQVFQVPAFKTWVSYTQRLEGSNAVDVMFKTLKAQYSWMKLYRLLAAAKKVEGTKAIATQLQKKLLASKLPGFLV